MTEIWQSLLANLALVSVLVVAFMLVSVVLFRRLADLERKYVALARAFAVREAQESGPAETSASPSETGP